MNKFNAMITKPGFYKLSHKDYLYDPALAKSFLTKLSRSGRHAITPQKETHAMRFGTAWHWLNLEPKKFAKRVKKKVSGYSEWKGEELHFKYDDIYALKAMKKALWKKNTARRILKNAYVKELPGFWELWTGHMAKIRVDIITDFDGPLVVDLKKCRDASEQAFYWDVKKYKYHWQAAFYLEGVSKITGIDHDRFCFMCTEAIPPYETEFYLMSDEWIELAWKEMQPVIEKHAECVEQKYWEGYPDELIPLTLRR